MKFSTVGLCEKTNIRDFIYNDTWSYLVDTCERPATTKQIKKKTERRLGPYNKGLEWHWADPGVVEVEWRCLCPAVEHKNKSMKKIHIVYTTHLGNKPLMNKTHSIFMFCFFLVSFFYFVCFFSQNIRFYILLRYSHGSNVCD